MAEFNHKEYAKQMRENCAKDYNGNIICSAELWEQIASIIENTADVVPKSEVEALLKENERWMMEYADYRAEVNSIIEKAKQEVAREIFEELDERFVWTDGDYYMSFPYFVYAELKKKYTKEV